MYTPVWVPFITGAGINSAIHGKLGGGPPDSKHPFNWLENHESLLWKTHRGKLCEEPFHVHKAAPPSSPRGESKESPGFLTGHSVIKRKTTTLNAYNTHLRTQPANLQHKAIQFRALMDLTIAVKRELTTDAKAQWSGGATL